MTMLSVISELLVHCIYSLNVMIRYQHKHDNVICNFRVTGTLYL